MSTVRTATLLAALAAGGCSVTIDTGFGRIGELEETLVLGTSGPKIALVEIEGLISDRHRESLLGARRPSLVTTVREILDRAGEDDEVAALLLRIDSPGGTASASESLYHELVRWKAEHGRPVVALFQGMGTSGAYYVAMAADEVIAQPAAVTGSIGVIMAGINVSGLMDKIGIADQTFTGGEFKDAGSPLRPIRAEEREQLQGVLDDLHARFRAVVGAGRPALTGTEVDRLADGRIYSAEQARAAGLIDGLGHVDDAVAAAERRAGIQTSRVIVYHRPGEYRSNLYGRAPAAPQVDVSLRLPGFDPLPPGFYFIWPAVLGAR